MTISFRSLGEGATYIEYTLDRIRTLYEKYLCLPLQAPLSKSLTTVLDAGFISIGYRKFRPFSLFNHLTYRYMYDQFSLEMCHNEPYFNIQLIFSRGFVTMI